MSDSNKEVTRNYDSSINNVDDSVVSLADYSFADDTVFVTSACDQSHITISSAEDISRSAFSSSEGTPGAYDLTDSITNSDATQFSFADVDTDTKWMEARARCGKRFEKALGENYFKSGRFEMKPVNIFIIA